MTKRHYFRVDNDFASRGLARVLGLTEFNDRTWYIVESKFNEPKVRSAQRAFQQITINETTSSSVAVVNNPATSKPKNKIGTLFGGTYNQKVKEETMAFAGEKVGQKAGDQVRGIEKAKPSKKKHPFAGRLVGGGAE